MRSIYEINVTLPHSFRVFSPRPIGPLAGVCGETSHPGYGMWRKKATHPMTRNAEGGGRDQGATVSFHTRPQVTGRLPTPYTAPTTSRWCHGHWVLNMRAFGDLPDPKCSSNFLVFLPQPLTWVTGVWDKREGGTFLHSLFIIRPAGFLKSQVFGHLCVLQHKQEAFLWLQTAFSA